LILPVHADSCYLLITLNKIVKVWKDGYACGVDRCGSAEAGPNTAGTGFCQFPVVVFTNRNSGL
jgi:hypothetical protein